MNMFFVSSLSFFCHGSEGVISGITQLTLGIFSVPGSISGPLQGKWWNDIEGKWIETNLDVEAKELEKVPVDDKDILGDASDENPLEILRESIKDVKDPFYYDVLGVDAKAEPSTIKRQYFLLARQYHPDKSENTTENIIKFQQISEAYQVLSDPDLRNVYDKEGRDGLSSDRTEIALKEQKIDASLLFAFLFGSDKFYTYIGRLATGTGALLGDDSKLSQKDARILQKRRCARIALQLKTKLQAWVVDGADEEKCIQDWTNKVRELSTYSYGYELVQLIGQVSLHYLPCILIFLHLFDEQGHEHYHTLQQRHIHYQQHNSLDP